MLSRNCKFTFGLCQQRSDLVSAPFGCASTKLMQGIADWLALAQLTTENGEKVCPERWGVRCQKPRTGNSAGESALQDEQGCIEPMGREVGCGEG